MGRARALAAADLDVAAARSEYLFRPPGVLQPLLLSTLQDTRDAPILFLFFNVVVLTLPAAAVVFVAPPSHIVGACYLAITFGLFLQRFMLALHFSEHRRLFKRGSLSGTTSLGPLNTAGTTIAESR
jgi:hypothetical protein